MTVLAFWSVTGVISAYGILSTYPLYLLKKEKYLEERKKLEPIWWEEMEKEYEECILKKVLDRLERSKAQAK